MPPRVHLPAPSSRYNPARDRRRVIWAILSLAIVLVAFTEAQKPSNWTWIAPNSRPAGASSTANTPLLAERDGLAPDQVRIVAPQVPRGQNAGPRAQPPDRDLVISADLLDPVDDSRVGVRAADSPAYFAMLRMARDADPYRFTKAARRDLTFATLMNDPREHRGEIVFLEGQLRRFLPIEAGPNDDGFDTLYEGWMFTDDAGRTNPYRIVCSSKPEGFPEGEEIRAHIRFAGYFFKRLSYATAHGQHAAPMFIGREVEWVPQRAATSPAQRIAPILTGVTIVMAAALAGVVFWARRLERQRVAQRALPRRTAEPASPVATREFLRELEQTGDDVPPEG